MQIALTGATGFLGRYILRHLVQSGHSVRCWHRPQSDRSGLESLQDQTTWIPGELGDSTSFPGLLEGADAVVHAALARAGKTSFRSSDPKSLLPMLEANLMGSLRLMQMARERSIPRFVFISTCAVHEIILEDRPLDEAHPLWSTHHYGAHKAALEQFVHSYGLGEGWGICALRPTGIYGLAHPAEQSKWYNLVGRVLRGEPIATPAGGKEVHAQDVARAVVMLLQVELKAIAGQAFNCYDRYIAEEQIARLVKEITGSRSSIEPRNRGPRHQIETKKLRSLGMTFGGDPLLRQTVAELIEAFRR